MTTSPDASGGAPRKPKRERIPVAALRQPVHFFALGFGSGLAPVAPGTFGSVVGVLLGALALQLGFVAASVLTLVAIGAGFWICGESARRLGVHDHPAIVWDEVAAMMLVMLAAPATWWGVLLGFGLFRLFDVWKPWPIREVDHGLGGGAGIMLDDILAALLAAGILILIRRYT